MSRDGVANESSETSAGALKVNARVSEVIADPHSQRLFRAERTMTRVRAVAALFALAQVCTYYKPYPDGVIQQAFAVVAFLAVSNVVFVVLLKRPLELRALRRLAVASLTVDFVAATAFVFVYTFDVETAIWAVLYLLPLEGAIRFQLRGALLVTAAVTVGYFLREAYGAWHYDNEFFLVSVTFRMGIAFMIAYVAGSTARDLLAGQDEIRLANVELADMNRSMRDFVAIASHDMRTPLSVIGGLSGVLVTNDDNLTSDQRSESLKAIHRNSQSLGRLVNDLLTVSSIEAGTVVAHREEVDIAKAVREAVAMVSTNTPVRVEVPAGILVSVDPDHLRRILVNLLTNADNYGEPPVTVRVRSNEAFVEIDVCDEGSGVPAAFIPLLFDRFTRFDSPERQQADGSGLGLAIVRGLAQRNGGDVRYATGEPKGARFTVVLHSAQPANVPITEGSAVS